MAYILNEGAKHLSKIVYGPATQYWIKQLATLFYLVSPKATSFETVEEVPDYLSDVLPLFFVFLILEGLVSKLTNRNSVRINDTVTSFSMGAMQLTVGLLHRSLEVWCYFWVYNNYHFLNLNVHHVTTWFLGFLGVDLCYYWFHRSAHEINIFWAAHVVHHSSEDFNLSVALRQSILQTYTSWFYYLPFAFILPPPIFVAHKYLNSVYQFWIHTDLVKDIGILNYVLNTPSHHRVHHGSNPYCIDKNYGGVLIIWDRLFGTFQREDNEEKVVYGLVHNISTFNPWRVQFHHIAHIFRELRTSPSWSKTLFYGPGWAPGKPRLGLASDLCQKSSSTKRHNPTLPSILNAYILVHFTVIMGLWYVLLVKSGVFPGVLLVLLFIYCMFSITTFGALFDKKNYAFAMEMWRITFFLIVELACWICYGNEFFFLWYKDNTAKYFFLPIHRPLKVLRAFYLFSGLWLVGRYATLEFYGSELYVDKGKID